MPSRRDIARWQLLNAAATLVALGVSWAWAEPRVLAAVGGGFIAWLGLAVAWPPTLASRVTLLRCGLIAGVAFFATAAPRVAAGVLAAAALLDFADGALARRRGEANHLGAVLDVETDALFVAVAAACALALGRVGAWVLVPAVLRPSLVLARAIQPTPARRSASGRLAFGVLAAGLVACCASDAALAEAVLAAGTALVASTFAWDFWLVARAAASARTS